MTADPVNTGDGGPDPGSDGRASPFSWLCLAWPQGSTLVSRALLGRKLPILPLLQTRPPGLVLPAKGSCRLGHEGPQGLTPSGPLSKQAQHPCVPCSLVCPQVCSCGGGAGVSLCCCHCNR